MGFLIHIRLYIGEASTDTETDLWPSQERLFSHQVPLGSECLSRSEVKSAVGQIHSECIGYVDLHHNFKYLTIFLYISCMFFLVRKMAISFVTV